MSRSRYRIIGNKHPHFLTCTVVNWIPVFTEPEIAKIVLDSLDYLQQDKRLSLYGYVILENHLHLIASAEDLSKEIGDFKSFTARKIIDYLKDKHATTIINQLEYYKLPHKQDRNYQLWQEGSHPQLIQGEEMMRQKIEYIHYNPLRRGYVDDPTHWRYSSARNYAGQDGILKVCMEW
ncbi:MAG: REP-associated tyrosine transposase [Candidatus Brocadiales bacterium]